MNADTIRQVLSRTPFGPVRVKMTSGKTFEIKHPEMVSLARSGLVIVLPEPDGSPSDRVEFCSFLHIASVETMAFT